MTKFEEEAIKEAKKSKVIAKSYEDGFTASDIGLNIKLGGVTHNFPWLEFAKNWHSDEEFQDLKSQLQQQALPVVPECVAEWIEILKSKCLKPLKNPETYGEAGFTEEKLQNIIFWIYEHQEDYMRAWLDGYTVEKPQLFYLKNKLTTSYLILDTSTGYFEHWGSTEATGRYKSEFTKQEIDSMETGSYEKIEVTE